MTKTNILWSIIMVVVITAGIVAFVLWDADRTSKRLSQTAEAIGLTALPTNWDDDGREIKGHTLTFAYAVGEKVLTRTLDRITWYEERQNYKVCYNPSDPDDSKLYPASHVCGQ